MIDELLARARSGGGDAFRALTEPHRRELHAHCYRIVGSVQDAEDLVLETLLAAWRGLDRFEHRASPRSWLYRIATNRSRFTVAIAPVAPSSSGAGSGTVRVVRVVG